MQDPIDDGREDLGCGQCANEQRMQRVAHGRGPDQEPQRAPKSALPEVVRLTPTLVDGDTPSAAVCCGSVPQHYWGRRSDGARHYECSQATIEGLSQGGFLAPGQSRPAGMGAVDGDAPHMIFG
jgi:hypothetical protein